MESGRERRMAQNELFARRVNESIDEERAGEGAPGPRWFVCECAHADCAELVDVGAGKYHEVRRDPRRFIVLPGHEAPDVERVVEAQRAYLVVEKVDEPGRIAKEDASG
jgi:hypothetical protein